MAVPRVLAVQHVAAEPPGLVADLLAEAGVAVDIVRADLGENVPRRADGLAGLVVMGGPMGAYETSWRPHLWDEMRLVESALARDLPMIGVCLGSQILASVLGARVEKGPAKEIGWYPVKLDPGAAADPIFGALPPEFPALHWHGDVFDLPPGATPLARSRRTERQAFRHGRAWGILFHLEATAAQVAAMAAAFPEELAGAGVDAAGLVEASRNESGEAARHGRTLFGAFARLATGGR